MTDWYTPEWLGDDTSGVDAKCAVDPTLANSPDITLRPRCPTLPALTLTYNVSSPGQTSREISFNFESTTGM